VTPAAMAAASGRVWPAASGAGRRRRVGKHRDVREAARPQPVEPRPISDKPHDRQALADCEGRAVDSERRVEEDAALTRVVVTIRVRLPVALASTRDTVNSRATEQPLRGLNPASGHSQFPRRRWRSRAQRVYAALGDLISRLP